MRFSCYIILITFCGISWRCTGTKEINPDDLGSRYFPLKTGEYRIYQVEGTKYISSTDSMEFSYFLKESVADTFDNLAAGTSYKIIREKRSEVENPWKIDSLWTARKDERTAIMVENNIPKVVLVFPVADNKSWDGNSLNGKNADEFDMIDIGLPFHGKYDQFAETTTVIQEMLPDVLVKTISQKEVYAKDIGLVYKENVILNYKQGDDYGKGIVESGIRYFQHLKDYGEE